MSDKNVNDEVTWLTSVNYKEAGPFCSDELIERARKRLFSWRMYVYRFPKDDMWRPARDIPFLKEILLKHFPLQEEDAGPAGGYVIKNSLGKLVEVSPYDAGFCPWEDAKNICENFSLNGIGGWRLPAPDELNRCCGLVSHELRVRKSVSETDEVIMHWSSRREGETAVAVVTCENKDKYIYPYILSYMSGISGGYWTSEKGPWRGNEIKCPVTDWRTARPVRDLLS